jgi:hypothetical protein
MLRRAASLRLARSLPPPPGSETPTSLFDAAVTLPKIDVSRLRSPQTGLPHSGPFSAERSGEVSKEWLARSPELAARFRSLAYLPPTAEFWAKPSDEALSLIASHKKYYEILQLVAEHNWPHLITDALLAEDAPLPHVLYEDIMKSLAFSSKQDDPMKQFALDPSLQRALLCRAAHHVLLDHAYFPRVEALFRQMELQQAASSEAYSAFIMACFAAHKVDLALTFLKAMDGHRMPFDAVIFAMTMHPGTTITDVMRGDFADKAKGLLHQQRIAHGLRSTHGAAAIGVHAAFVLYSLTHAHARKWDVVRQAVELDIELSERTLRLIGETFEREQGRYCGPLTCKALCKAFAGQGRVDRVAAVLLAARLREQRMDVPLLSRTAFSDEEVVELFDLCMATNPADTRKHGHMLKRLVIDRPEPVAGTEGRHAGRLIDKLPDFQPLPNVGETRTAPSPGPSTSKARTNPPASTEATSSGALGAALATTSDFKVDDRQPAPGTGSQSDARSAPTGALVKSKKPRRLSSKKGKSPEKWSPSDLEGFKHRDANAELTGLAAVTSAGPGRVLVRAPPVEDATTRRQLADAAENMDEDHFRAEALKQAVASRAAAAHEVRTMRQRLTTAWMNPNAIFE